MKVKDIMTRDVVRVDKDERLGFVLDMMRERGISKMPVVEKDRFVGIVTDGDIVDELGAIRNRGIIPSALHVTAALRKDVPTVDPEADVAEVLRVFNATTFGIVPVVVDGRVEGVVTKADLLPHVKGNELLRECMVKELYAVSPRDRVIHARRVMLDHGIERVPVIDGGRLVGIVGEMDMALGLANLKVSFRTQYQDHRLKNFYVEDIMRRRVVTGSPDMTVRDAAALMTQEDVGSLPVVDGADKIAGMVTRTDLLPFVEFQG